MKTINSSSITLLNRAYKKLVLLPG